MKILIKIGSAIISNNNKINYTWIEKKVNEIAELIKTDNQFIIISSGAVAAGMEIRDLTIRPKDTLQLQLLSGQGQIKLIKYYKESFKKHNIFIAQLLLTHHNFSTRKEEKTIKTIIDAYIDQSVVPIINENDMINKEELEYNKIFPDNDILAAIVAIKLDIDLVIILSDVDGLYKEDPKKDSSAALLEHVPVITKKVKQSATKETNTLGLGGMFSKVEAAEIITNQGIDTIVANGKYPLADIISGKVKRTIFTGR